MAQSNSGNANGTQPPPGQTAPQQMPGVHNEHVPARMHAFQPGVSGNLPPQPTVEDALATLVHASGVIFAGEVYAIRMPVGEQNKGTKGGAHSTRQGVVDIEFRVDQGVRGTSIGDPYVLHEAESVWRSEPDLFATHERAVFFLTRPDAEQLSAPVGGSVGVLPMDASDQVDLSRLHALVRGVGAAENTKPQPTGDQNGNAAAPANQESAGTGAAPANGANPPRVTDVTTSAGEDTLATGTDQGRMPELREARIPYLALMRDIYVLVGAESAGAGNAQPAKSSPQ